MPGDPQFNSVVFLSHFDGSDGQRSATDTSNTPHTITFIGASTTASELDTAEKKFGASSLSIVRSTFGGINCLDSPDWSFGSGNFTIEGWFKFRTLPATDTFADAHALAAHYLEPGDQRSFMLRAQSGRLVFAAYASGTAASLLTVMNPTVTLDTSSFHHIAVVRDGTTGRMFYDGTQIATASWGTTGFHNSNNILNIGYLSGYTDKHFNGWIDDFRITKGVARYTADFSLPGSAFPDSIQGTARGQRPRLATRLGF